MNKRYFVALFLFSICLPYRPWKWASQVFLNFEAQIFSDKFLVRLCADFYSLNSLYFWKTFPGCSTGHVGFFLYALKSPFSSYSLFSYLMKRDIAQGSVLRSLFFTSHVLAFQELSSFCYPPCPSKSLQHMSPILLLFSELKLLSIFTLSSSIFIRNRELEV